MDIWPYLLRTDHASLTWLLSFKELERQLAQWLEQLQDYEFTIQHRAGQLHRNAEVQSRWPCAVQHCQYYQ